MRQMQKQSSPREVVASLAFLLVATVTTAITPQALSAADQKPNLVIFFADDLGYGDIGSFGAQGYETPNLDRMADEGRRFTSFYVSQAVCGASRASLLSGCYANRISLPGAPDHRAKHGVHVDEVLLPELLRDHGYATGMVGKWHLGHRHPFLPLQNGFEEWLGLPYSNDMWPYHPTSKVYPPLPLFDGNEVINANVTAEDQKHLTTQYTERAVDFVQRNAEHPFFLYVAYAMPHVPLFVSEKFDGATENGLFGDVISEIDWSVGQVLEELKKQGLDENTLVIFTSDNGPNTGKGGNAGPLKGDKGSTLEGGVRVPFVARWPGTIPGRNESDEAITGMDLLPTLTKLAGGDVPDDRVIDGKDIWPLLAGKPNAKSPHEAIYYLRGRNVSGIRVGDWKYLVNDSSEKDDPKVEIELTAEERKLPRKERKALIKKRSKATSRKREPAEALYNLREDIGEQDNLFVEHPDITKRLKRRLATFETDLRKNLRPAGVASEQ